MLTNYIFIRNTTHGEIEFIYIVIINIDIYILKVIA